MAHFRIYCAAHSIYRRFVFPSDHSVPDFPLKSLRFVDSDGDEVIAEDLHALYESCNESAGESFLNPIAAICTASVAPQFHTDSVPLANPVPVKYALPGPAADGAPGWSRQNIKTLTDLHPSAPPVCGAEFYFYDAAVDGWCAILSGAELEALSSSGCTASLPAYLICGNHVTSKDPRTTRAKDAAVALATMAEGVLPSVPHGLPRNMFVSASTPTQIADAVRDICTEMPSTTDDAADPVGAAVSGTALSTAGSTVGHGSGLASPLSPQVLPPTPTPNPTPTSVSVDGASADGSHPAITLPSRIIAQVVGVPLPMWAKECVVPMVRPATASGSLTPTASATDVVWKVVDPAAFALAASATALSKLHASSTVADLAHAAALFTLAAGVSDAPDAAGADDALGSPWTTAPYNAACVYARLYAAVTAKTATVGAVRAAVARFPVVWPGLDERGAAGVSADVTDMLEHPHDGTAACFFAVADDDADRAVACLAAAAARGFVGERAAATAVNDGDFAVLRSHPAFVAMLDVMRTGTRVDASDSVTDSLRSSMQSRTADPSAVVPSPRASPNAAAPAVALPTATGTATTSGSHVATATDVGSDAATATDADAADAATNTSSASLAAPLSDTVVRSVATTPTTAFAHLEAEMKALGVATANKAHEQVYKHVTRVQTAWDAYRSDATSTSAAAAAAAGDAARSASHMADGAARACATAAQSLMSDLASSASSGKAAAKATAADVQAQWRKHGEESGTATGAARGTLGDVVGKVNAAATTEAKKVDVSLRTDAGHVKQAAYEAAAAAQQMAATAHATLATLMADVTAAARAVPAKSAPTEDRAASESEGADVGSVEGDAATSASAAPHSAADDVVHRAAAAAEHASKQAAAAAAVLAERLADTLAHRRGATGVVDVSPVAEAGVDGAAEVVPSPAADADDDDDAAAAAAVAGVCVGTTPLGAADVPADVPDDAASDASDLSLLF